MNESNNFTKGQVLVECLLHYKVRLSMFCKFIV